MKTEKSILIGHPSAEVSAVIAKLKAKGEDFVFVDITDKESLKQIEELRNPAFEPEPIPFTNPYKDIVELKSPTIEHFGSPQKKFRKQNNRKHKKSRR